MSKAKANAQQLDRASPHRILKPLPGVSLDRLVQESSELSPAERVHLAPYL
jgi:hypothetical protein